MVRLCVFIHRVTMSSYTPSARICTRNALKACRSAVLDLAKPAPTGEENMGAPNGTRAVLVSISSASVSTSLSPASTLPAVTASVTS